MSFNVVTRTSQRHPGALANPVDYTNGPNPSGLCMCGCGARTAIAKWTQSSKGTVGGFPRQYVAGHNTRRGGGHVVDEATGCWIWQGSISSTTGYGTGRKCPRTGLKRAPHVIAYESANPPVPDGYHVDHDCHNQDPACEGNHCMHRRCVNPAHLRAVPPAVNILAGLGRGAVHAARSCCSRGHEYTAENLVMRYDNRTDRHYRGCRTCNREDYLRRATLKAEARARQAARAPRD